MKNLLPTYVTIAEFATIKDVQRKSVYKAITDGLITTEKVGKTGKIQLIDTKKYGAHQFRGK